MFTGIIEEIGTIDSVKPGAISARIRVQARLVLEDIKTGDSINTNGACLTVTSFDPSGFIVDVMAETMRRTNLGELQKGSQVNLERALKLSDRLGGHLVSGHIDGVGQILEYKKEDIATWITLKTSRDITKYVILKGSVALDGVSLTVAEVHEDSFKVSIIPHTSAKTTLLAKRPGDQVNIECDMIGKYIEHFILLPEKGNVRKDISLDFLRENGFI